MGRHALAPALHRRKYYGTLISDEDEKGVQSLGMLQVSDAPDV